MIFWQDGFKSISKILILILLLLVGQNLCHAKPKGCPCRMVSNYHFIWSVQWMEADLHIWSQNLNSLLHTKNSCIQKWIGK